MKKPINGVAEGLKQVLGLSLEMSPYFRQPIFFQRYFEDGLSRSIEQIRQAVKGYFPDAAEVSASFVGTELLRVNVVMQNGDKYIVTAHRLSVGETEVWSFAVYDDSLLSGFLAGLLKLPRTAEAWRPYLLERIPDADEPEHSSPGTVNIRFRVDLELGTDLAVWVQFCEKSQTALFNADWLAATESGGWMQIAGRIYGVLDEARRFADT
jgi:hypothetical protein